MSSETLNAHDSQRSPSNNRPSLRDALGIVALSEDPDRHAHLSENIISCFHAPDRLKLTGGATVDFKQFAAVMSSQVCRLARWRHYRWAGMTFRKVKRSQDTY